MSISRKPFAFVLGVVLTLAAAAPTALAASVTYTYTGNDFGYAYGAAYGGVYGPYSTSDFVSASFTFASPLPDDLDYTNEASSLISWSITDQEITLGSSGFTGAVFLQPFSSESGSLGEAIFDTDGSGNIDAWSFGASYVINGLICSYFPNMPPSCYGSDGSIFSANIPSQEIDTSDATEYDLGAGNLIGGVNSQDPGVWTETSASSTPEPSTTVLGTLGGAALLIAMKRKHRTRLAGQTHR